jgi:hypothetical protein
LLVKEDQAAPRAEDCGDGSTDTDRVKLHFEIRKRAPVDPAKYLPPR